MPYIYNCNCGRGFNALGLWIAHMIATGHKEDKSKTTHKEDKTKRRHHGTSN